MSSDFNVIRSTDLVNSANIMQPVGVPDHSLLHWNMLYDFNFVESNSSAQKCDIEYDTRNIPENFLK